MPAAMVIPVSTIQRVHAFIRARNRQRFTLPDMVRALPGAAEREVAAYLRRIVELGVVRSDVTGLPGRQGKAATYWQHSPLPRTTRHPPLSQWSALDRAVRRLQVYREPSACND